MIDIDFFNITQDRRSFNRNLGDGFLFRGSGSFKTDTSIINPIIPISNTFTDVFKCNYVKVGSPVNRYYFVNDVVIKGNFFELHCSIDVLYTYRESILNKKCMIKRQERNYAQEQGLFFNDEKFPILQSKNVSTYTVGQVSNSYGYYLTVNGGVQ